MPAQKTVSKSALIQATLLFVGVGAITQIAAAPSITVTFGKPTQIEGLCYTKLYAAKPYKPAVLFLYDNGLYKVLSPGESHYGAFVLVGKRTDSAYQVNYMALPSADWGNATASLQLRYHSASKQFTQETQLMGQGVVPNESGYFVDLPNPVADPTSLTWSDVQQMKGLQMFLEQCETHVKKS